MKYAIILFAIFLLIFVLIYFAVFDIYFTDNYTWPLQVYYNGILYTVNHNMNIKDRCPKGYSQVSKTVYFDTVPTGEGFEANANGYVYFNEQIPNVLYFVYAHKDESMSEPQWIPLKPQK